MPQLFALLSLVFMMGFVIVFDNNRWRRGRHRFLAVELLSQEEVTRLQAIWSAC